MKSENGVNFAFPDSSGSPMFQGCEYPEYMMKLLGWNIYHNSSVHIYPQLNLIKLHFKPETFSCNRSQFCPSTLSCSWPFPNPLFVYAIDNAAPVLVHN